MPFLGVDCAEFTRQQRIMMSHLLRALFFLPHLAFFFFFLSSSFFSIWKVEREEKKRPLWSHLFVPNSLFLLLSFFFFLFHMESRKRREEAAALVVRVVPEMERSSTDQSGRHA